MGRGLAVLALALLASGWCPALFGQGTSPAGASAATMVADQVKPAALLYPFAELPRTSRTDLGVKPPESPDPTCYYRFAPDGPWIPFIAPLELSAVEGEERVYLLETRFGEGGALESRRILIDKKPPVPPSLEPASGLYRSPVETRLASSEGTRLFYAILGSDSAKPDFIEYLPNARLRLDPPAAGARTQVIVAYCVDAAGNVSPLARRIYRLAAPGFDYAPPAQDEAEPGLVADDLSGLGKPQISGSDGVVELSFSLPETGSILAAVNPAGASPSSADFFPLEISGSRARLTLRCPPGYKGELSVFIALRKGEGTKYLKTPYKLELAWLPRTPSPSAPNLVRSLPGGPGFLVFPQYDGLIRYAIGASPYETWTEPVSVGPEKAGERLSWYGIAESGIASEPASITIASLGSASASGFTGLRDGDLRNTPVQLVPGGAEHIRYEISRDGSIPPEPTSSSPLVNAALGLDGVDGAEISYVLRYRGFSGESALTPTDEGGILRFTIDRKPPAPPAPREEAPAYSFKPYGLELHSPDAEVYVEVSVEDRGGSPVAKGEGSGGFQRLGSALELSGSAAGPVTYVVRAYAQDRAGNRSVEMTPIRLVVDISTLYVASGAATAKGEEAGDGSRERPFDNLDEALALALAPGSPRSIICLRGEVGLGAKAVLDKAKLSIKGGFDSDWNPAQGTRATLVMAGPPGDDKPFFALDSSSLTLEGLQIRLDPGEASSFVRARTSSVSFDDVGLSAAGSGSFLAFDMTDSKFSVSGSEFMVEEGQSVTMVAASGGETKLRDSSVSASLGVKYYGAFSQKGGSLSIVGGTLESQASLGTRLITVEGASIQVERSFLDVSGGPGFLSLGSFTNANGLIANSRLRASWKGGSTLFKISGGGPAFVHDSVFATTVKGKLRFFDSDARLPSLRNSIFACVADGGEFAVSRIAAQPGDITADCLSGFQMLVSAGGLTLDLAGLNALNARIKVSLPCLTEDPTRTWRVSPLAREGSFALNPSSACVNAAIPIEGFTLDYSGSKRPGPGDKARPDIGADEASTR